MNVEIEILQATYGKFSQVSFCYTDSDNNNRKVDLHIDFLPLYDFSKDTSSVRFDFFLISSLVYGVDNLLSRELYSVDGWAREIEVVFPVKNVGLWQGNEALLSEILKFLTGDYWTVSFTQLNVANLYIEKKGRWKQNIPIYEKQAIKCNSLFSGGLDSLVGVINSLNTLGNGEKIILASHFDSNSVGPNSDQTALEKILSQNFPDKIYWVQTTITLSRDDVTGTSLPLEDSYRSRSFLFIGIGLYFFTGETPSNKLLIPENGTISLNYPLTPSRASSLSTRTTHPYMLQLLQDLINKTIGSITVTNPYSLQTKGEMVANCINQRLLEDTYGESVSCGKRGRKTHWDIKTGTNHCGVCMPCIYRRAALHKKGLDTQVYGNDILNAVSINNYVDMPALFDFLKTTLPIEKIKRDLLVNGSLPLNELDDYANVVSRSRTELLKWISDKGNSYIKTELGLR
jgi:hypothetical protein